MKAHYKKIKILTLIISILISLLSCGIKSGITKSSKQLASQSGSIYSIENHKKNPIKSESAYSFENQEAWLELKELLANDLMSAEELGVIDCRGYDRNSTKLRLIRDVSYNILNQYYRWFTYQAKDGFCIENLTFDRGTGISFFLSLEDSSVLLSAGKGYHFNKLGLVPPKTLSQRTIFFTINGTPCGDGTGEILKNKSIYTNACEEIIYYRYND